jgi:hypothetical protein
VVGWQVERRDLRAFGGRHERREVEVYVPDDEPGLLNLLRLLGSQGRKVAPLGAGLSFDGQGMPEEVAIETSSFDEIATDANRQRLRVGAGVLTGQAVEATLRHGLLIPVLPSTSRVTMGGTASANAYSRMTPGLGRESRYIRSLRLVTPRGEVHRCSREDNADLFYAAVGGFGLLGFITEIEYDLIDVGPEPALRSTAHAFDGVDGLDFLIPENRPAGLPPGQWPGAGSVIMSRDGRRRTMISRHRYDSTSERRKTLAHQRGKLRLGIELFVRQMPRLASWFWERNWVPGKVLRFIDDVEPATFFMDASLEAAGLVERIGGDASVMQQSYILPVRSRESGAAQRVTCFAQEAMACFDRAGLSPSMFDVGFLPAAEPFAFAGNPGFDAFMVSAAFVVGRGTEPKPIAGALEEMTHVCLDEYEGTVHLAKQAFCADEVLRELYAEPIAKIRALREAHDPDQMVRTALGARLGLLAPRVPISPR